MKLSFMKYSIPVGLAVLSHEALMGIAKFAKVKSIGTLELIVPALTFVGCIVLINKLKKDLSSKHGQQTYIAPPNYDKDYEYCNNLNNNQQPNYQERSGWEHDREFITHERGVKEETFENGVKRTVYEFERRSSTW